MLRKNTKNLGFTLIELLVVIAIIGILSAVVLTSLNSSRQKAQDAKAVSDVKQVALAMELGRSQSTGDFPTSTATLVSEGYLNPFPSESIDQFVVDDGDFCVSTTLSDAAEIAFVNASQNGAGYSATEGTATATCPTTIS